MGWVVGGLAAVVVVSFVVGFVAGDPSPTIVRQDVPCQTDGDTDACTDRVDAVVERLCGERGVDGVEVLVRFGTAESFTSTYICD